MRRQVNKIVGNAAERMVSTAQTGERRYAGHAGREVHDLAGGATGGGGGDGCRRCRIERRGGMWLGGTCTTLRGTGAATHRKD